MKIGMLTSSYPRNPGDGAGSFVGSLARALVARGHEVHVIAPYDPAIAKMDQGGVQVHRFRYAPADALCLVGHARSLAADVRLKRLVVLLLPSFVASALATTLRLHRQRHFDLLHGHWAVPGGTIAGLAAQLTGLPLVISLHGSDVYVVERQPLYAAVARASFRRAAWVAACSEDLRARAVARGLAPARSLVIPYGVDLARYSTGDRERLRQRLGISAEAIVVGALGRLVYKKGFQHLIAAMPHVLAARPNAYCVIGGDGDLREALRAQIHRSGLQERVLLAGSISWQETPDFYAMCDVVAVPSVVDAYGNVDGLPNVLLEAMAAGRPVVASRVAGIPDVMEDGVQGLLVPPGDEAALAQALIRMLGDAPLRARLGAAARQLMTAAYSWQEIARRYEALYQQALDAQKRSHG